MNVAITLNVDELNALLTTLGKLSYTDAAYWVNLIHQQATPQIQAYNEQLAAEQATLVEEPVPVE